MYLHGMYGTILVIPNRQIRTLCMTLRISISNKCAYREIEWLHGNGVIATRSCSKLLYHLHKNWHTHSTQHTMEIMVNSTNCLALFTNWKWSIIFHLLYWGAHFEKAKSVEGDSIFCQKKMSIHGKNYFLSWSIEWIAYFQRLLKYFRKAYFLRFDRC